MKLDELDCNLVAHLDFGARIGIKRIAEILGRSLQVLDYRLRALQKGGVIRGFYPVIDSFRLGYRYGRLMIQLADLSDSQIKGIQNFVKRTPAVLWCYRMEGDFNLIIVFWTRSLEEFDKLSSQILAVIGHAVLSINQSQVYKLEHFPVSQVLLNQPNDAIVIQEQGDSIEIDTLDQKILAVLSNDARVPFLNLAKVCGTSDKVAAYRIDRLEESGVVRGYRPLIAWEKAGYLFFKVFIRIDYSKQGSKSKLDSYLKKCPELLYMVHVVGAPGDIDVEIVVPGYLELFSFIERLRAKFPGAIRSVSHYHFTDCYKVNYFPRGIRERIVAS